MSITKFRNTPVKARAGVQILHIKLVRSPNSKLLWIYSDTKGNIKPILTRKVETINATHLVTSKSCIDCPRGGRKYGSGEKLCTARGERKRRVARCDKAAGWRQPRGEGTSRREVRCDVRGARALPAPAPRRSPPVSRPPTLLVLVWLAPLRAPHSYPDHDACRPAVAANATSTLPAKRFS